MKKNALTKNIFLFLAVFSVVALQAQENNEVPQEEKGRFLYDVVVGIGRAKYSQTDRVDITGSAVTLDFRIDYRLSDTYSLGSGINFLWVDANGVFQGNEYSLEQRYLRIPLKITHTDFLGDLFGDKTVGINNRTTHTYGALGVYAGTLLREEIKTLDSKVKTSNGGWNMGMFADFGAKFLITEDTWFRVSASAWIDFFEMKKNGVERKLEEVSTINISFSKRF